MMERVVKQFTRSFFVGVKEVTFYDVDTDGKSRREMCIYFNSHNDLMKSYQMAEDARDIFYVDEESLFFLVDRDKYETIIYYTAAKDAMTTWMRRMVEDKDREECEIDEAENKESDENGSSEDDN